MSQGKAGPLLHILSAPEMQVLLDHIRTEVSILQYLKSDEKSRIDGMLRWDAENKNVVVSKGGKFVALKTESTEPEE